MLEMRPSVVSHALQFSDSEIDQRYCETLQRLSLSEDQLVGKHILDIGAGFGVFAVGLKRSGFVANIVNLDRNYGSPIVGNPPPHIPAVIADARMLPFEDDKFDLTLSNACAPILFLTDEDESYESRYISAQASLREMLRVTRPGGEIRVSFTPSLFEWYFMNKILDTLTEKCSFSYFQGDQTLILTLA